MVVVDDGSRSGRRTDDNPFSFKRFLQPRGSHRTPGSGAGASIATLDLANDLPDFVQGHYHSSDREHVRPRGGRLQAATDAPLPDFALDTDPGSRFHTGSDLHSFGSAAVAGGWMPNDASAAPSNDMTSHHNETSNHRLHSPVASNSATHRVSQLSDFSIDSETESSEQLDEFGLLESRNASSHHGHAAMTPTDGPLMVAANSAGGLPDFLSDSAALGVVDVCTRSNSAAVAAASSTVKSSRPLTNGFASPDSEAESVLSRVRFRLLFLCILIEVIVCEFCDF